MVGYIVRHFGRSTQPCNTDRCIGNGHGMYKSNDNSIWHICGSAESKWIWIIKSISWIFAWLLSVRRLFHVDLIGTGLRLKPFQWAIPCGQFTLNGTSSWERQHWECYFFQLFPQKPSVGTCLWLIDGQPWVSITIFMSSPFVSNGCLPQVSLGCL